jgi:inhibitor of KinA
MQTVSLGDNGIIFQFSKGINDDTHQQVMHLFHAIINAKHDWIIDLIPAYDSLAVFFNLEKVVRYSKSKHPHQWVQETLNLTPSSLSSITYNLSPITYNLSPIAIPACYDISLAPDLEELASTKKIAIEEVIKIHSSTIYKVYMLGFLPGFPYMGTVHKSIQIPRKQSPATHVAAGSIGIAGAQTGIYPLDSPGGWQIIAKTPIPIFDVEKENPCLLAPGNQVQFVPISLDAFNKIKSEYI